MIVGIDIDDCLMPWLEIVHQECILQGINPNLVPYTQWNAYEDYGCTREQWLEVVDTMCVEGGLYHTAPYPGAIEALRELYDMGHEIHLITARGFFANSEKIRRWTYDWVENFNVPGKLYFAKDKGKKAQEVGLTHAIDDAMHNVQDLLRVGVDAYLMTQPHNQNLFYDQDRRVNSVAEFVERILTDGN